MEPLVRLREITSENRAAVLALCVAPHQERYVGTVSAALRDAEEIPEGKPWFRVVHAGDTPVGFVMLSWNVEPDPPYIIGPWFLWKLIIDKKHQRKGMGRHVVHLVGEIVRNEGAVELLTSYVEGEGSPAPCYERVGFYPTGDRDNKDEIIVALDLT